MPYTEIQTKNAVPYYYRTLSLRNGKKFQKFRIYLGKNLNKKELKQKEEEADLIIESKKQKKKSPKNALNEILHTRWNIRHNRASIAPYLTTGPLFEVFSTGFTPLFGDSYNQLLMVYNHGKMLACWPELKIKKIGVIAFKQLYANPRAIEENRQRFKEKSTLLLQFLKKKNSQQLSNAETIKAYNHYFSLYKDACLWGEPFPFAVYEPLTQYLENCLKKAVKNEKERLRLFTLMISPTEDSFINREEKELDEIISRIHQEPQWRELFRKNKYALLEALKTVPELWGKIRQHQKKYFWVSYDYFGSVLETDFFVQRIKEKLDATPAKNRNNLQELAEKQQNAFCELLAKKNISEKDRQLFLAAQQATLLLDYKKEMLSQAHYYINSILQKAASNNNLPYESLLFATKEELSAALNHKLDLKILEERKNKSAYYFSKSGLHIFVQKEADQIIDCLEGKSRQTIREVSGICASPGTLVGRVRLIKTTAEIGSIQKGEILVTGMTTPDYLVAMKKATAIVTDEGGITCHAAIVSRELGIPCIVGTKNATALLKTGDIVELHAGNGVVKIIKTTRS